MLPIACYSFGNNIIISLTNDSNGKIFFCNHDKNNKTEYISESLTVFFDLCKSEKISDASRHTIKEREDALAAKGRGNIITDDLRKMWQSEIDKYGNMTQEEVGIN